MFHRLKCWWCCTCPLDCGNRFAVTSVSTSHLLAVRSGDLKESPSEGTAIGTATMGHGGGLVSSRYAG